MPNYAGCIYLIKNAVKYVEIALQFEITVLDLISFEMYITFLMIYTQTKSEIRSRRFKLPNCTSKLPPVEEHYFLNISDINMQTSILPSENCRHPLILSNNFLHFNSKLPIPHSVQELSSRILIRTDEVVLSTRAPRVSQYSAYPLNN